MSSNPANSADAPDDVEDCVSVASFGRTKLFMGLAAAITLLLLGAGIAVLVSWRPSAVKSVPPNLDGGEYTLAFPGAVAAFPLQPGQWARVEVAAGLSYTIEDVQEIGKRVCKRKFRIMLEDGGAILGENSVFETARYPVFYVEAGLPDQQFEARALEKKK